MSDITGIVNQPFVDEMIAKVDQEIESTRGKDSFDGDMFLKLLMTELQNQDPLKPTDTSEIMNTQATLSQVEQSLKQTESLDNVKEAVDIGLADMANTLNTINNTLQTLVASQNNSEGDS